MTRLTAKFSHKHANLFKVIVATYWILSHHNTCLQELFKAWSKIVLHIKTLLTRYTIQLNHQNY